MTILMCEKGGLMEDPAFHWEKIGEAEGSTVKEVADNLAKKDKDFAKYYDPKTVTYWGWELKIILEKQNIKIIKFNALLSYQYYINDIYINKNSLIEKLAKMNNIEIICEGDGSLEKRDKK